MKNILPLLFSIALISSCINKKCDFGGAYEFELPVTLSPARDTFNIGDTITISSIFSDTIFDRKTNMDYLLEDFKFYPGSEIVKIDSIGVIPAFENNFEVIIRESYDYGIIQYSEGGDAIIGEYNYENNRYSLVFKLVTKEKGLFYLEQGTSFNLRPSQDFPGKCNGNIMWGFSLMNDGADNNIDMLSSSPDPNYNERIFVDPVNRFHKFGGYCFYVKE